MKPATYRFREKSVHLRRVQQIQLHSWIYLLNEWTGLQCQQCLRINEQDLEKFVDILCWPTHKTTTRRNQYKTSPELSTLILLRRLASPCQWNDLVYVFFNHLSQMSEVFQEALQLFWRKWRSLLGEAILVSFIAERASLYAYCIERKCSVLDRCVELIGDTVLGIVRPSDYDVQHAGYNGRKKAQS